VRFFKGLSLQVFYNTGFNKFGLQNDNLAEKLHS
jgi:hypothetical protein